jgi:hypothetical protein
MCVSRLTPACNRCARSATPVRVSANTWCPRERSPLARSSKHPPPWQAPGTSDRDGKLTLTLGPRGDTLDLTHWDGDMLTFQLITENAPPAHDFEGDVHR